MSKKAAKIILVGYFVAMTLLILWGMGAFNHPAWIVVYK